MLRPKHYALAASVVISFSLLFYCYRSIYRSTGISSRELEHPRHTENLTASVRGGSAAARRGVHARSGSFDECRGDLPKWLQQDRS
jgi:hypothetical protein